jgi:plasmid stabilization system protein ParE
VSPPFITPIAKRDITSIWRYIARDSVHHADRVEQAIIEACFSAAKTPGMGHRREGIRNPRVLFLAVLGYERYSIAYLAGVSPLRVLRVVHGARDVPRLFP